MSTRIYDAYKINVPLHEFKKRIDSVKEEVAKAYRKESTEMLDACVKDFMETGKDFVIQHRFLKKGLNGVDKNGKRRYYYNKEQLEDLINQDLDVSAPTFVFYVHETGNYCQIFCRFGNQPFKDLVESLEKEGIISDFHYQNQTDPEVEGMTDEEAFEEYERRREIWDEILECDSMGTPVNCGFTYNMIDTFAYYRLHCEFTDKIEQCAEHEDELLKKQENNEKV